MHELPITEKIVQIASKHCEESGADAVTKIRLIIGENSGIVGSSVQMYFDVISEGTVCQGALLDMVSVKPKLRCKSCGHLFERRPFSFSCPLCGGDGERTEIGREFYIETIEVTTDDAGRTGTDAAE